MSSTIPGSTISTILRHDSKVTSYKIALLRAINDVVLAYADMTSSDETVAIPLRLLADRWIAFYWPFVDPNAPILQGRISQLNGKTKQDISFRRELAQLYAAYEQFLGGTTQPSDGAVLVADLRVERLCQQYPETVLTAYAATVDAIVDAVENPIRYAGPRGRSGRSFPDPFVHGIFLQTSSLYPAHCPQIAVCLFPQPYGGCFVTCRCGWKHCACTNGASLPSG